jgi:hypothetical protein
MYNNYQKKIYNKNISSGLQSFWALFVVQYAQEHNVSTIEYVYILI